MAKCSRRRFLGVMASGAVAQAARGAPFVPVRDPQVVAFAPGGTMVATGCSGLSDTGFPPRPHPNVRKAAVVAVWDVATRKRLFRWETYGDFRKLAFSATGKLLAACRLYATADGVELDEVRAWDLTGGRAVKTLDRCHSFDFSPDGHQMAVLSRTRCVLYDVEDWSKRGEVKSLGEAIEIAYTADGASVVGIVRDADGFRLRRCLVESGEPVAESLKLPHAFYTVAVAADGAIVATGHDNGQVVVWDAQTLEVRSRLQTGSRGIAHPFFSPDATTLAAGCQALGDVVIWNLSNKQEMGRYTFKKGGLRTYFARSTSDVVCPERDPTRFCFSPDGEAFFAGCYGGILRATRSGQELGRFGE